MIISLNAWFRKHAGQVYRIPGIPTKPLSRRNPFTVEELAERWSCTREAVYAAIRHQVKPLPAFRVGGKLWRIRVEDVEKWESTGGSTRSDDTGSGSSETKPSSAGETSNAPGIDTGSEFSPKAKAESRLMRSLAASKP